MPRSATDGQDQDSAASTKIAGLQDLFDTKVETKITIFDLPAIFETTFLT